MAARIFRARPLLIALALGFLGLAALVTASAVFPSGQQRNLSRGGSAPADRLEAAASDIAVVDGSTLRLAQRVVRLLGIEAPRRGLTCQSSASIDSVAFGSIGSVDCGAASTAALAALVRQLPVACEVRDNDPMGRPLAICEAGGTELNRALVAGGWARVGGASNLTNARTDDLRNAESLARAEHRGLWAIRSGAVGAFWDDNGDRAR